MPDQTSGLSRGLDLSVRTLVALASLCVIGVTVALILILLIAIPNVADEVELQRQEIISEMEESFDQALEPTNQEIAALGDRLSSDLDELESTNRDEREELDDSLTEELALLQKSNDETVRLLQQIDLRDARAQPGRDPSQILVSASPQPIYGIRVGVGYEAFDDPEHGWTTHTWMNPDRLPAAGRGGWPDLHLRCRHGDNNGAGSLLIWITTKNNAQVDRDELTVSWRADNGLPRIAVWNRITAASDDQFAFALDRSLNNDFRTDMIGAERLTMDIFVEDNTLLSYFTIDFLLDVPVAAHIFQCGS